MESREDVITVYVICGQCKSEANVEYPHTQALPTHCCFCGSGQVLVDDGDDGIYDEEEEAE